MLFYDGGAPTRCGDEAEGERMAGSYASATENTVSSLHGIITPLRFLSYSSQSDVAFAFIHLDSTS